VADVARVHRGGLELALRLSAGARERHPCAPPAEPPAAVPLPREVLDGPEDGVHLRIAAGEAAIARIVHGAHQAGAGCVEVRDRDLPRIGRGSLALLLPSARRLEPLGLSAPRLSVRPLSPPEVRIAEDGSVALSAEDVRVDVEAVVDGRVLRLASAALVVRGIARVVAADGAIAIDVPPGSIEMGIASTWSAPILGATDREVRTAFEALAALARGVLPERTVLSELGLPADVASIRSRRVVADGARALVLSVVLEPAERG